MKKNIVLLLGTLCSVGLLVILVILFLQYRSSNIADPDLTAALTLTTPTSVTVTLLRAYDGGQIVPKIQLTAPIPRQGSGCPKTTDLHTTLTTNSNNLTIDVLGYPYSESSGPYCLAMEVTAQTTIDLAWSETTPDKIINVRLSGQDDVYTLSYLNYHVSLSRNSDATTQTINLFPENVDVLFIKIDGLLTDTTYFSTNYQDQLRTFALDHGLTPADTLYPTIEQKIGTQSNLHELHVISEEPVMNSQYLGVLPDHAQMQVYIKN